MVHIGQLNQNYVVYLQITAASGQRKKDITLIQAAVAIHGGHIAG